MKNLIKYFFNKVLKSHSSSIKYENTLSVSSMKKFLSYLPKKTRRPLKVLDVGCGIGLDAKFFVDNECDVLGIDLSKEMIKLAKERAPYIHFEVIDFMKLEPTEKYNGIWCSRVFHHMPNIGPSKFFGQVKNLLKEDGVLYITSIASITSDIGGEIIKNNLVIRGLTENSFKSMVIGNGFEILEFNCWDDNKGMEIFAKLKKDGSITN